MKKIAFIGGPAMYAVKELEDRGFRSSVINAVKAQRQEKPDFLLCIAEPENRQKKETRIT